MPLNKDRLITIELLAEESAEPNMIIYYPELRAFAEQCVEESNQKQIGQQNAELLEQVRNAIQTLRSLDRPVSQAAIIKVLHISMNRLKACPQVKEILEQSLKEFQLQKEVIILEQMKEAIVSLQHNSGKPITQRAIARSLCTSRNSLNFYPRVREIMVQVKVYGQELKEKQNPSRVVQPQRDADREHRLHKEQADLLAQGLLGMVEEAIEQMHEQGSKR